MKAVKKCGVVGFVLLLSCTSAFAQDPITLIIKEGIKKVIKAVDLKIQRLQNKTIWLQNAQKTLENKMQELKLGEISGWVEKQRKLYADYYDELWQVKSALSTYQAVKGIIEKQVQLVNEYKKAYARFREDRHFTGGELTAMQKVYEGILEESIKNIDGLFLVVNAFTTQMSDGKRLEIIHSTETSIEQNLVDLRQYNQQNVRLSLQRSKDQQEIDLVKALYGLK